VAHLLALRAVEPLEQGGDDALLDVELGSQRGDFRGQFGNLLLGRFDDLPIAGDVPGRLKLRDLS
jgi:hypothetical protein